MELASGSAASGGEVVVGSESAPGVASLPAEAEAETSFPPGSIFDDAEASTSDIGSPGRVEAGGGTGAKLPPTSSAATSTLVCLMSSACLGV